MRYFAVLLSFLLLCGFTGPGPRSDGYIYVTDYGAVAGAANSNGGPDATAAIQTAEDDAYEISGTVKWPTGVYNICSLNIPEGVVNAGTGRPDSTRMRAHSSIAIAKTNPHLCSCPRAGALVGGPYELDAITVYGGTSAIYAASGTNSLTPNHMSMVASKTS